MAAHLYPGIKSLHLQLDTPYDLIRTDDIRDDLSSVKVWISETSGFNPLTGGGTLAFDGLSLSITLSNLETNKQYYVKYAFISKIDPTVYTVSTELTQTVYDENTKVYGYLTNDPTGISTEYDGTGGDFSLATGTFKVFNLGQEVTGNGVVYSVKPNSTFGILGASINPTTGVYSCTGLSQDTGTVSFLAVYNGVTIQLDWNVFKGLGGKNAPVIKLITIPADFIYKDQYATVSETAYASINAKLTNITGNPIFTAKAYTANNVLLGNIPFTSVDALNITISGSQFGTYGVSTKTVIVTASIDLVEDSATLYRINNGTDQITVELTNPAHPIPAASDGTTVSGDYIGSGTRIYVKQGNVPLPVDTTSPYEEIGSWNIFDITTSGITCDPTPIYGPDYIEFDAHSAITSDRAYIDYTIYYRTTTGQVGSQVARQSFSRTKTGQSGTALVLTQTGPGHVYDTDGLNPQPSSQQVEAKLYNYNPAFTYYYEFIVDGITAQNSTATTFTYTPKANYADMPDYVLVKVRKGSASGIVVAEDELVIVGVKAGGNALVSWVKNPVHQLPVSAQGEIIYALSGCEIMVAEGTNVLAASNLANASMPNGSFKVTATGVGITPNASPSYSGNIVSYGDHNTATADTSRITYNLTIKTTEGKIVTDLFQQQNFVLKRDGKDAINTATIYLYSRNNSTTTPPTFSQPTTTYNFNSKLLSQISSNWYQTIPSDSEGTTIWVSQALVASDPGSYTDTVLSSDWSTPVTLSQSVPGTAGLKGLVSKIVYAVVTQTIAGITPPNTPTGNSPTSPWQTTVPAAGVGQIIYYSYGRYNPNTVTVDGVAADTTIWSSPIGASVFQDIRSDNWTGATPSNGIFTSTTGYYLNRSEGSFYGNNVYLIGTLKAGSIIQGGATIAGVAASDIVSTAYSANSTATSANALATSAYNLADDANSLATSAYNGLSNKLNKNAADILSGTITLDASYSSGIKVGGISWNSSGTISGTGVAITKDGIVGAVSGTPSFTLNAITGAATFSGTINTNLSVTANGTIYAAGYYTGLAYTIPIGTYSATDSYTVVPTSVMLGTGSNTATAGNVRGGVYGISQSCSNSVFNVGVLGFGGDAGKGIGVVGSGTHIGVFGSVLNANTAAIHGRSLGGTGQAGAFEGTVNVYGDLVVSETITCYENIYAYLNIVAYSNSDARLKNNIKTIQSPLEILNNLSGYTYDWNKDYLAKNIEHVKTGLFKESDSGLIAQEVLKVMPEAVFQRKDGTLAVNYEKLIPYLLEAVKELDRRTK